MQQASDALLMPIVCKNLCNIYHAIGDFSKAEESYPQVLRISPGRTTATAKFHKVRIDKLINTFANLIAGRPIADACLKLGRTLGDAKWIEEARYSYEKALQIDPSLQQASAALATLPVGGSESRMDE